MRPGNVEVEFEGMENVDNNSYFNNNDFTNNNFSTNLRVLDSDILSSRPLAPKPSSPAPLQIHYSPAHQANQRNNRLIILHPSQIIIEEKDLVLATNTEENTPTKGRSQKINLAGIHSNFNEIADRLSALR